MRGLALPLALLLVTATAAQALDLRLPKEAVVPRAVAAPSITEDGVVILQGVTVRGKVKDTDESLKRARDAVAKFGARPRSDTPVQNFIADRFAPPPPKNSEPNDKAARASQHGLATAGCAGCSVPENRR